jgi:hypothetical protein
VKVDHPGGRSLIEVKTILPGAKNDKITMHKSSLGRKDKMLRQKENRDARSHTVAVDTRGDHPVYYHREGLGSFRLAHMTKSSLSSLKSRVRDVRKKFEKANGV